MTALSIINAYCEGCEDFKTKNCSDDCIFNQIKICLNENVDIDSFERQEYCAICAPKKGKKKEIFYDDGRGGLRISSYCPECGKKM